MALDTEECAKLNVLIRSVTKWLAGPRGTEEMSVASVVATEVEQG